MEMLPAFLAFHFWNSMLHQLVGVVYYSQLSGTLARRHTGCRSGAVWNLSKIYMLAECPLDLSWLYMQLAMEHQGSYLKMVLILPNSTSS